MEKTYLIYDCETSALGLSQVVEFAAVRTDLAFNVLSEHHFIIKLTKDTVPSPQAFLTHGITLGELSQGLSEELALVKIHQLMNQPGTISGGYNTLAFDDEILRFSFFRHLLEPYTHQYANGCGRIDFYPCMVYAYLFAPHLFEWPQREGRVSLKLADLNEANQWVDGQAHRAMVDVRATLALAKRLFSDPTCARELPGFFNKQYEMKRLQTLSCLSQDQPNDRLACLVAPGFGQAQSYQRKSLLLGHHNHYKNQTIWLDLSTVDFKELTQEQWQLPQRVTRKKMGDLPFVLPLDGKLQEGTSAEDDVTSKNSAFLLQNPDLLAHVRQYHREWIYPEVEGVDMDASLYQSGFKSTDEVLLCRQFHQTLPHEKFAMLDRFCDMPLRQQALRFLWRYHTQSLPDLPRERDYWARVCGQDQQPIVDYRGRPRQTAMQALIEVEQILNEGGLDEQGRGMLNDLKAYLRQHFSVEASMEDLS